MSDMETDIDIDALRQQWNRYLASQPHITSAQLHELRAVHNDKHHTAGRLQQTPARDSIGHGVQTELNSELDEHQHDVAVSTNADDLGALDAEAEQPADDNFIADLRRKSMKWQPHSTKKAKKKSVLESSDSECEIDAALQRDTDQQIEAAVQRDSLPSGVSDNGQQYSDGEDEVIDLCDDDDSESEVDNARTFARMSRKFDLNLSVDSDSHSQTDAPAQHSGDAQHSMPALEHDAANTSTHREENGAVFSDSIDVDDSHLYPVSPLMLSVRKKKPTKRIIESDCSDNDENVNTNIVAPKMTHKPISESPEFVKPSSKVQTRGRAAYSDFKSKITAANQARKQIVDSDSSENSDADAYDYARHSSDDDFVVDDDDTGYNVADTYSDYSDTVDDCNDSADIMLTKQNRDRYTAELYGEYNHTVLRDALPADMKVEWNQKLNKTAGYCYTATVLRNGVKQYNARIELSIKVVDRLSRLRRTLAHEMCHAAAWLIDHSNKPPHGKVFKQYASKFMRHYSELEISTCHSYEIFYKYRWQCIQCQHIYGRHSNSVDIGKKCCGKCSGQLVYLGQFDKNGTVQQSKKAATDFALYMKQNYSAVKHKNRDASQKELFQILSAQYKSSKVTVDELSHSVARQLML